ncbi:MAG: SMP-30/gluconolactonase/LRE family protein [Thermoguttaceae bacterium]|nr:SMP-30/gluconolactonase/LRE family protein [Thermoguttaceae bacterium]
MGMSIGLTMFLTTARAQIPQPKEIVDERGIVATGAKLERTEGRYAFTEGPSADVHGNVFFTDQPNNRIMRWDATTHETTEWMNPSGRSNGMYFDAQGFLWSCADAKNELWKIAPDQTTEVVLTDIGGKFFNGPNDVWVRPDGSGAYFTDPYYHRDYWQRGDRDPKEAPEIVYYLPEGAAQPVAVDTEITKPNGLVGTPDGKTLYVADIGAGKTYRYRIESDGTLRDKTLFCEMGSDGMTIDDQGNVYLTGPGVVVFNPEGQKIAHIPVPEGWTANICFGGKDRKTLFITASVSAYTLEMNVHGVQP